MCDVIKVTIFLKGSFPFVSTGNNRPSFAAFLIFLVERAILLSNGNRSILWFRIFLGFIVASLGSISLDEVIFKQDIDNQVSQYKQDYIKSAVDKATVDLQKEITDQGSIVLSKYSDWQKRLDDVNNEMKGDPRGSGYRGKGEIAEENIRMALILQSEYLSEKSKLDDLREQLNLAIADAKSIAGAGFNQSALLMRIRALFDLIGKDKFMLGVYILFTLFLFCLEFIVVLIKIGSKNSIDEELEITRDVLLRSRACKILNHTERHDPSVMSANYMMKQNISSILS